MGSIPNPRTWVDKEIPPFDVVNAEIYSTVAWLLEPPMCKLRQTVSQSIPNASATALQWQTEDTDPYNWHNSNTNTSRITPTFPGWYRGWYGIGFTGAAGGNYRMGYVMKNAGVGRARRDSKPPTTGTNKSLRGIPFLFLLNGTTDYLEVLAYQDSGSAMLLPVGSNLQAEFFLRWWGPV